MEFIILKRSEYFHPPGRCSRCGDLLTEDEFYVPLEPDFAEGVQFCKGCVTVEIPDEEKGKE